MRSDTIDKDYMNQVLNLAGKGRGKTSPNPLVGSLIVKNGMFISEGFHKKAGLPHAEIEALNKAGKGLAGATLYVNLEPCNHWGKTPPCVDRIIDSGIKKIVIACKDPNPQVNGRSIAKLRRAGIKVKAGVLSKKAKKLNEVFFTNMDKNRAFIAVKFAQTLDGKIANSKRKSKWITSQYARKYARLLRGVYDAVLVGVNTVLLDNPRLDSPGKQMQKVILDPDLRIKLNSKLFKKGSILIFTKGQNVKKNKAKKLQKKGEIIPLKYHRHGFVISDVINTLYKKYGITSIFVEGGSATLGKFFDAGLVDKTYIFVAPKLMIENNSLNSLSGKKYRDIDNLVSLKDIDCRKIGNDFLFWGYPQFK